MTAFMQRIGQDMLRGYNSGMEAETLVAGKIYPDKVKQPGKTSAQVTL